MRQKTDVAFKKVYSYETGAQHLFVKSVVRDRKFLIFGAVPGHTLLIKS
jgi:hypothetical protein